MPFRPMPLLDFEIGIYDAQEPWRAPPNSFVQLENAYVERGRLLKRKGYELFGQLAHDIAAENIGDGGGSDTGTLANSPVAVPVAMDDADISTATLIATDGTYYAYGWAETYYLEFSLRNFGYIAIPFYQYYEESMGASGSKGYTGYGTSAVNCPDSLITFEDVGGTGEVITVAYIKGYQAGEYAPTMPASGDIDPSGTNTWDPSITFSGGGYYDVTFNSVTTGAVTFKAMRYIGFVVPSTGFYYLDYFGTWADPTTMDYQVLAELPVMGIRGFFTQDGNEYLLANDTRRIYVYNSTTKRFDDLLGADEWTGDNADHFQYTPYEDVCYINNNHDVPKVYDPSGGGSVSDAGTDYDGDTTDEIDYASFFVRHKNRGIYLGTSESSTIFPQRARYTPVNDIEYSAASSTVSYAYLASDAPTNDQIVSAFHVGDNIVVPFNRSMWVLRYNGDPTAPYEWQQMPAIDGAASRFGFISFGDYVVFRGTDALMATDGVSAQRFDFDIPGFSLAWNQDAKQYTYGVFNPHDRQGLMIYASQGDSLPEDVLAIQLDDDSKTRSFSIFKPTDPFHCFGRWRGVGTLLWDDVGIPWDDVWWAWDDLREISGSVLILAGDRTGNIYSFPSGYTDNGTEFTGVAKTARLNPTPGRRSHMGFVEIIADAQEGGSINLLAYADYDPNPYLNATVDLTPNATYDEKVIRRIRTNRIANFHTLRVEMNGDYPIAIDQIAPFFKAAGPMRELP